MLPKPLVIVIMGVAGSGKSTVGVQLAERLGAKFVDADDFHSQANRDKMTKGLALTDEDRLPWLESIRQAIDDWLVGGEIHVLACSALKQSYRDLLRAGQPAVQYVYLKVSPSVISRRLASRKNHYMKAGMAAGQFAALEEPLSQQAIIVNGELDPTSIVDQICALNTWLA